MIHWCPVYITTSECTTQFLLRVFADDKKCLPSCCVYTKLLYTRSFTLLLSMCTADSRILTHFVCLYAGNTRSHCHYAYMHLITSSQSTLSWCTFHFSCCVYKAETHVTSTFVVSVGSWYTRLIRLAMSRHRWYTSFFLIFLFIRC